MDIYDVNEDLIKTLVKMKMFQSCLKEFTGKPNNSAKVNLMESILIRLDQINKIKLKVEPNISNCDKKSADFRTEGNNYFTAKNRNLFKAMELYNKSICFAEKDSENISIGYANRSAVLFEWKRYKECLDNIRLARDANYPDRLMHKLQKREEDCKRLLEHRKADPAAHEFKLSYDPHPIVPYIASGLNMRTTAEQGRHIYTDRALSPGEVIAIEEPFCTSLLSPMKYIRCATCNRENYLSLIPCSSCTSAMFCSEQCKTEGWDTFHKFECPIIDLLFGIFGKIHQGALRVTLTALSLFQTIDECSAFCNNADNQYLSCFDLNYKNLTKQEHYKAIYGLATNEKKRTLPDLLQRSVIVAVLKRFLLDYTPLKDFLGGEEGENFFTELLFRHLQSASTCMHSFELIEHKLETADDQYFATGASPFIGLLNHSCAPNTVRVNRGTRTYLFVLRPIEAGGVVYGNYGYHYATQRKKVRQEHLDTQYHFVCKCEACEKDYPLFLEDQNEKPVPEIVQPEEKAKLMSFDRVFALGNYTRFCELLKKYAEHYPCVQITAAEESLKMALNIIVDSIPLKSKVQFD